MGCRNSTAEKPAKSSSSPSTQQTPPSNNKDANNKPRSDSKPPGIQYNGDTNSGGMFFKT